MELVFLISVDGSEIELFLFSLALMCSRTTLFDSSCKQTPFYYCTDENIHYTKINRLLLKQMQNLTNLELGFEFIRPQCDGACMITIAL
jgi:hypothetical protein